MSDYCHEAVATLEFAGSKHRSRTTSTPRGISAVVFARRPQNRVEQARCHALTIRGPSVGAIGLRLPLGERVVRILYEERALKDMSVMHGDVPVGAGS